MRAKIYNAPNDVGTPPNIFDHLEHRDKFDKLDKAWHEKLKQWCIKRNPTKYVGEIIRFPVADGQAEYMVASLIGSVELIHLETMDAYQSGTVHLMHGGDIIRKINADKRFQDYVNAIPKHGDIDEVIAKVGIKTINSTTKEGYMPIKWKEINYLLPIYSGGYDHQIYKYLCNNFGDELDMNQH